MKNLGCNIETKGKMKEKERRKNVKYEMLLNLN